MLRTNAPAVTKARGCEMGQRWTQRRQAGRLQQLGVPYMRWALAVGDRMLLRRVAPVGLLLALILPQAAHAGVADDVLACKDLNLQACPALSAAAASRKGGVTALAQAVQDARRPGADRGKLAMALALLDAREQVPILEVAAKTLQGEPAEVELYAALARLGSAAATAPLLQMLQESKDLRVRSVAAAALGQLRAAEARPALLAALAPDQPPRLQQAAVQALGRIANAADEATLIDFAGRAKVFPPARAAALEALASMGSSQAVVLATMLIDAPQRDVGRAALLVLQRASDAKCAEWQVPAVAIGLDTPGLRAEAARTATLKPHPDLQAELLRALVADGLDDAEFRALVTAVVERKPLGAASGLVQHLRRLTPERQAIALQGLAELKEPAVAKDLLPWLANPDAQVAGFALYALKALTGKDAGRDQAAWRRELGLDAPAAAPEIVPAKPAVAAPAAATGRRR